MEKEEIAARAKLLRRISKPPESDTEAQLNLSAEEKIRLKAMFDAGLVDCVIRYDAKGNLDAFGKITILDAGRQFLYDFDHPPFPYKKWTFWAGFWFSVMGTLGWILAEYFL